MLTLVGPSQFAVVLLLGLLSWPAFARIVRARVMDIRSRPFVEAAHALGASPARIVRAHVLPATLGLLPAKLLTSLRLAVFGEATLAFLGVGDPAAKSWGATLGWAFGDPLLFARPTWVWWVLPPVAGILVLIVCATHVSLQLSRGASAQCSGTETRCGTRGQIPTGWSAGRLLVRRSRQISSPVPMTPAATSPKSS